MWALTHASDVLSLLWEKHHQLGSEGQLEPIDVSTQMQNALHLAKYVFPRQYGLSTPFAAPSIGLKKIRSFEDREQEIKVTFESYRLGK